MLDWTFHLLNHYRINFYWIYFFAGFIFAIPYIDREIAKIKPQRKFPAIRYVFYCNHTLYMCFDKHAFNAWYEKLAFYHPLKSLMLTYYNPYYRNVFIIFSLHTEMDENRCTNGIIRVANYTTFVHRFTSISVCNEKIIKTFLII